MVKKREVGFLLYFEWQITKLLVNQKGFYTFSAKNSRSKFFNTGKNSSQIVFTNIVIVLCVEKERKLLASQIGRILLIHLSGDFTPSSTSLWGIPWCTHLQKCNCPLLNCKNWYMCVRYWNSKSQSKKKYEVINFCILFPQKYTKLFSSLAWCVQNLPLSLKLRTTPYSS